MCSEIKKLELDSYTGTIVNNYHGNTAVQVHNCNCMGHSNFTIKTTLHDYPLRRRRRLRLLFYFTLFPSNPLFLTPLGNLCL